MILNLNYLIKIKYICINNEFNKYKDKIKDLVILLPRFSFTQKNTK